MYTKKFIITVLLWCWAAAGLLAQNMAEGNTSQQIELGLGTGNSAILLNAGFMQTFALNPDNSIRLGYGLRLGWLRAHDDLDYVTASQAARTGRKGLDGFLRAAVASRLDTFITENPGLGSVNLALHGHYFFNPLLEIGLYAEIIGFSFGPEQDGIYNSPVNEQGPRTASASPETFNFFLTAHGTYQTELFARYWLTSRVGWKAGLIFYHSVYRTAQPLNFDNQRFKNFSTLFTVALSYRWGVD